MTDTPKGFFHVPWQAIVFVVVAAAAIYSHVLPGEFISDDFRFIAHNPVITQLRYQDLWSSFNARFLVGLTFMLNYDAHGLNPVGYHVFSLIIHTINAVLVFIFCRQTIQFINVQSKLSTYSPCKVAWLAMAIFLCHPVQTQAVSFIAQRGTLMVMTWYLLAHIFYMKGRQDNQPLWLVMVLIPLLLGFVTKEIIITAGITLILCELLIIRPAVSKKNSGFPWLAAYLVATLIFPMIFFQTKSSATIKFQHLMGVHMFEWKVFLTQFNVLVSYLRLFVFPVGLRADYYYPITQSVLDPRFLMAIGVLGLLVWFAITNWRKRPIVAYGIGWFFITKSVEFLGVSLGLRNLIYENWLYLSMAGLCLLAGVVLSQIIQRDFMLKVTVVVLVLVMGVAAHTRNYVWVKEIDHYKDLVAKEPRFPSAYLGLSDAYARKNMGEEAVAALEEAIRLKPDFARALNNLSRYRWEAGDEQGALELVRQALMADPMLIPAHYNMGFMSHNLGMSDQAVKAFQCYLKHRPHDPSAHYLIAQSYRDMNQIDKTREHLLQTREYAIKQGMSEWLQNAEKDLEDL